MSVWDDLIYRLEGSNQKIDIKHRKETQVDDIGTEIVSEIDYIEFPMQGNDFKVEKITRPLVLDKKSHYSHTAGQKTSVEYVLSPDETTVTVKAYRLDPEADEWIELGNGGGFLG